MSETTADRIGEDLIQLGWRQGSVFPAASAPKSWLELNDFAVSPQQQTSSSLPNQWKLCTKTLAADDF